MEGFGERFGSKAGRDGISFLDGPWSDDPGPEAASLAELRQLLADLSPVPTDWALLQFLRRGEADPCAAAQQVRACMAGLRSYRCDGQGFLAGYKWPSPCAQLFPVAVSGRSRAGAPVCWFRSGRVDFDGVMKSSTLADLIRTTWWIQLHLLAEARADGLANPRKLEVFDLTGLDMSVLTSGFMDRQKAVAEFLELVVPEFVERLVVINAPSFFNMLWAVLSPLLSEQTRQKLTVCGSDFEATLSELIPPEHIPERYGGSFSGLAQFFGCDDRVEVPEELHLSPAVFEGQPLEVGRLDRTERQFEVPPSRAGKCALEWTFSCDGYDIQFGVRYKPSEAEEAEDIVPARRYECHLVEERDCIECERPGLYVLCFDNSYSILNSKSLVLNAQLVDRD